jgi:hypothetical protein
LRANSSGCRTPKKLNGVGGEASNSFCGCSFAWGRLNHGPWERFDGKLLPGEKQIQLTMFLLWCMANGSQKLLCLTASVSSASARALLPEFSEANPANPPGEDGFAVESYREFTFLSLGKQMVAEGIPQIDDQAKWTVFQDRFTFLEFLCHHQLRSDIVIPTSPLNPRRLWAF